MKLVGEIIGIVAIIESLAIYAVQKRKNILTLKIISNVLWGTNNLILGSYTGAVLWFIAILRDFIYLLRPKYKWADNGAWIAVFILLSLISPVIEWTTVGFSVASILPAVGSLFNVVGGYSKRAMTIRLLLIPAECLWLTYAVLESNISLVISEAFLFISAVTGIIIELITLKKAKKAEQPQEKQ